MNEENVATRFFDSLAEVEDVESFFFQDLVHLTVIIDDDLVVHLYDVDSFLSVTKTRRSEKPRTYIRFGRGELELNDTNLCLLDPGRSTCRSDRVLMKQYTIHQFSVIDRSSDFLDESDVAKVDVGRLRGNETEDGIDGDGGEDGGILRDDLCEQKFSKTSICVRERL